MLSFQVERDTTYAWQNCYRLPCVQAGVDQSCLVKRTWSTKTPRQLDITVRLDHWRIQSSIHLFI